MKRDHSEQLIKNLNEDEINEIRNLALSERKYFVLNVTLILRLVNYYNCNISSHPTKIQRGVIEKLHYMFTHLNLEKSPCDNFRLFMYDLGLWPKLVFKSGKSNPISESCFRRRKNLHTDLFMKVFKMIKCLRNMEERNRI